jgi:hypothetical protein
MRERQRFSILPSSVVAAILSLALFSAIPAVGRVEKSDTYGDWMKKPQTEWPQLTMVNQIDYTDKHHPIAGCGFLLDTGDEVLAATAKHILTYFKSKPMHSVDFENTLKLWKMFPKNSPGDVVVLDSLINADPDEPIDDVPSKRDWLLFTVKERSENIQPLRLRTDSIEPGEPVYIVGWRYSDKDCPQVVYEGNFVKNKGATHLISTKKLADNTMPGLSGSPVIDSNGYVIGLMSRKAGKLEQLASTEYPVEVLRKKSDRH